MTQKWRKIELLVADIERALDGTGAEVKSPDRLADVNTGQFREVDISVRQKIGTKDVVIAFECRDHKAKQDILWIEQLATKKKSLGLAALIAVSTSGFTSNCQQLASREGIELRTLESISLADIKEWASLKLISSCVRKFGIKSLLIDVHKPYAQMELHELLGDDLVTNLHKDAINTKFLGVDTMPELMSVGEIVSLAMNAGHLPDSDELKDGHREHRRLDILPSDGQKWFLPQHTPPVDVTGIHMLLIFEYEIKQVAVQNFKAERYANELGLIAHRLGIEVESCLGIQKLGAILDENGMTKFTFSLDQSNINLPIRIDD